MSAVLALALLIDVVAGQPTALVRVIGHPVTWIGALPGLRLGLGPARRPRQLPASRLTALLLIVTATLVPGHDARSAWRAVWRDARHHCSPNAGWPEAAMAGAPGLRLAGPRVSGDHWVGDGRAEVTARDIRRALRLFRFTHGLAVAICAAVASGMALA